MHADELLAVMDDSGEADAQLWWLNVTSCLRRQQGSHGDALDLLWPFLDEQYEASYRPRPDSRSAGSCC